MREEDDAHAGAFNRTAMPADPESARLAEAYCGYARDPRRQRAWAADNPGNVEMRHEIGRWLLRIAGDRLAGDLPVLDAGCGAGYWLRWLRDHGVEEPRLHGVDLIGERARQTAHALPRATVDTQDVRSLSYPDGMFGLVLLFTVLSSQAGEEDMLRTLHEARRVLAPGGVVVVWDLRRSGPRRDGTKRVPRRLVNAGLGPSVRTRSVTLVPPLARRLGRAAPRAYPWLAAVPLLRTHRLAWAARGRPAGSSPRGLGRMADG